MKSLPGTGGAALDASSMVSSVCGRHSREEVRESQEAPPGGLLAQHLDQLEERGRRENAGEAEAGGRREVSQLEPLLGRERASALLERRVGERLCGRQALGEGADERRRIRLAELFHAGRVEVRWVVAVYREGVCELGERARARAVLRDRPGEKLRVPVRNAEWLQHLDEPRRRNLLEVLPVQPGELLVVEARRRGTDAFEREARDHLGEVHPLSVLAGRPAQEREEVVERGRQVALRLELLHARRAVAFAQLLAVGAQDHPEVSEDRRGDAERPEERHVLRRIRKVVDTADDVRDSHRDVVNADREVVERVTVRAHEDEIVQRARRKLRSPLHGVVHDEGFVRHVEAHDELLAGRGAAVGLLFRNRARSPVVPERASRRLRDLLHRVELVGRFERAILLALREKAIRGLTVEGASLALEERALVPVEAEPAHRVEDLVRQVAAAPLDVRVLDAEDERAPVAAREEPVVEGRARPSDVKGARRGRREAHAGSRHRAARIAAALWGSTFIVNRLAIETAPPLVFVLVRFALAGLVLYVLAHGRPRTPNLARDSAVIGILLAIGIGSQIAGQLFTTASKAAFVTGLSVPLTPVAGYLMTRKKPSRENLAGLVLAAAGFAVLTWPQGAAGWNRGDLLIVATAVSYAILIVVMAETAAMHDVRWYSFGQIAAAAVAVGVARLAFLAVFSGARGVGVAGTPPPAPAAPP